MEMKENKVSIDILIDENVKVQAEEVFSHFGMDLSTAVNSFLNQCVKENRLPFNIKLD